MNIERNDITIAELFEGYQDRGDEGVVACGGTLDVRPPYQREFVYKEKQRDDVIRSVLRGFLSMSCTGWTRAMAISRSWMDSSEVFPSASI